MSAAARLAPIDDIGDFPSLVALFVARAAANGDRPFVWAKKNREWQPTSWAEAARQVAALASGLKALALERGDRVMLVSENRPEWAIADLAIMAAGCVTVPAYTTNTERDHEHVFTDSGAKAAIVSTARLARPLLAAAVRTANCNHIVAIEPLSDTSAGTVTIHPWDGLIGEAATRETLSAAADLTRRDIACIIYTSGTGGAPRGVMLDHGAILHNVEGAAEIFVEDFAADENEVFLSFLPLSHSYEHSGGLFLPIGLGSQIYYAEGVEKLASNMEEVRPTIMMVVPRLFEAFRQRILNAIEKEGRLAGLLLRVALAVGSTREERPVSLWARPIDHLVERLLRPRIRKRFGGRIKAMVSGGAPLNPQVGRFFEALGLTILQGYGQTESGPIISVNRPKVGVRMDSVGPPMRNTEVRIAEDGEILARGEMVMQGYWRNPELTDDTVRDGWLHTGDVGHLDEAGRLVITDRKKDLIVLDKGDNVAPQRVEGMLTLQPEILQAMVVGDRKPHVVALIVPDPEWTAGWMKAHGRTEADRLRADTDYLKAISSAVDRVNAGLSVIEKVRRFTLADEPFTVDNRQLTPSVKIRRHAIREIYGDRLEALYGSR